MKNRQLLLSGTSALALLVLVAGAQQAQATGFDRNFVFGTTSNVVTATTAASPTVGAIAALSSQVNNQLQVNAAVEGNSATTLTGATVVGGPSATSSNLMSATAIANQFSNGSGAAYVVDPSGTPAAGNAVIGTSQLNYNSLNTASTARLGQVATTSTQTITVSKTTTTPSYTGANGGMYTTHTGSTYTVISTTGTTPYHTGDTFNSSVLNSSSPSLGAIGPDSYGLVGTQAYLVLSSTTTSTSQSTVAVGGTGNSATFVADAAYGAPVAVDNNIFAARINGNLALSSISGGLPLSAVAAGPASVALTGFNASSPVGTSIVVTAPISVSNVQQNLTNNKTATKLTGSVANTLVSALFAGTDLGFNGGSVSASGNQITASAAGNSATVGVNLNASSLPVFAGGASVFSAQGNSATGGSGTASSLVVEALNQNSTLRVQQADSTGALSNMIGSNAALSGNSITSRAVLNDITAQTLTTGSTLYADGTGGQSGQTVALLISPTNTDTNPTLTSTADYVNAAVQSNSGNGAYNTVAATAKTDNAVIGYFGGVTNGTVNVQGNAITTAVQGNGAVLTTTLPYAGGDSHSVTAALQTNDGIDLTGTLSGTRVRVSESAQLSADLSIPTFSTVSASNGPGGTLSNANLNIGSATSAALGNTVSSTVLGNNATASAIVGLSAESSVNSPASLALTISSPGSTPAGTLVSVTAPLSVAVVQQNSATTVDSNITNPLASTGNNLFQIDAYSGLATGTATIGNNTLRATAAGNLGSASAAVSGFGGNTINGGVGVATVQGNVGSDVMASLGNNGLSGPVAAIGIGALDNATAQVVGNQFAAVAAGNSASGSLSIASGTIASGSLATAPQFTYGSAVGQTANYAVGNSQVNAGTTVVATNLDAPSYDAAVSSGSMSSILGTVGSFLGLGSLSSHLNVGAESYNNANALVNGNTVSTTALGNEYAAAATGFVSAADSASSYTSLAVSNVQLNVPSSTGTNTSVTSANVGNGFIVSTADTHANATNGVSSASSNGTVTNSILSVANNTASAAATLNTANLAASGIATSGSGNTLTALVNGNLKNNTPAASTASSNGAVTVSNVQANLFDTSGSSLPAVSAISAVQDFGVNWNGTGSAPSGSQFLVNGNAASATATANNATLSASLGNGPAYVGGLGLNNVQTNVDLSSSASTASSVLALTAGGFFNAGTGVTGNTTDLGMHTDNSTISVSGNSMTTAATVNQAALSVTAPSTVLVQAGGNIGSHATAGASGASAEAQASIAVANTQAINGTSALAGSGLGFFTANASATNGVVNVNANSVTAAVTGNTATTTLAVPRIDGTMEAFNAQSANNATFIAGGVVVSMNAGSTDNNNTINTPVSVSNNLVTAASTVNNYAASMTGLGQTGAATSANSSLSIVDNAGTMTASRLGGDIALVSNQSISGVSSAAYTGITNIGITLANSSTTSSPLSVNANTVSATANGNVSAQSLLANGPGAADSRAGFGLASAQALTNSTVAAIASTVNIGVATDGSALNNSYFVSNSPVSVSGNIVGAGATGNSAALSTAFGSSLKAIGTGMNSASSIAQATGSSATADYGLLNQQMNTGGNITATTMAVSMGYAGTATSSPVNVQNNLVYATAFGNTATMSQTASLAGGSMQSTNYQSNVDTTVSASVTGTSMQAAMSAGANINSPINVTGNVIRAVAVGNSVTNAITR